jgi:hypothetical protein
MKRNRALAMPAEIIPRGPDQVAADYKQMIARIVEEKIAEAMSHGTDSVFQPFLQSKTVTNEIKRLQKVHEVHKFSNYFEDWGCLACETREARHESLGMCTKCYRNRYERMRTTLRNHAPDPGQPQQTFVDTVKLARAALAPSIEILTAENSGPPHALLAEKYRTQREAALEAGIHPQSLVRWIALGKIQRPATKLSATKWLWSDEDIARIKAFKNGVSR